MRTEDFYRRYASTPLPDRDKPVMPPYLSGLKEIYFQMKKLDDEISELQRQQASYMKVAEKSGFLKKL